MPPTPTRTTSPRRRRKVRALSVYFKDGRAKVELAIARGKARYDKRQAIAKREAQRETQRALKGERE
jgi:tmRNA-binding protein